jgi:hypothetical protein
MTGPAAALAASADRNPIRRPVHVQEEHQR